MGRRYYQSDDIVLLAKIRDYLYKDLLTIKGVQKKLRQTSSDEVAPVVAPVKSSSEDTKLQTFVQEMQDIKEELGQYL